MLYICTVVYIHISYPIQHIEVQVSTIQINKTQNNVNSDIKALVYEEQLLLTYVICISMYKEVMFISLICCFADVFVV